jgi:hypothetical protein
MRVWVLKEYDVFTPEATFSVHNSLKGLREAMYAKTRELYHDRELDRIYGSYSDDNIRFDEEAHYVASNYHVTDGKFIINLMGDEYELDQKYEPTDTDGVFYDLFEYQYNDEENVYLQCTMLKNFGKIKQGDHFNAIYVNWDEMRIRSSKNSTYEPFSIHGRHVLDTTPHTLHATSVGIR